MKICLIADATSVHTVRWAEYFAQQGDEVHLITYEPPIQDISGVTIHVIQSRFDSLYLAFMPRHLKIYLLVKKLKPDIVHAHFISKFGFHAAFLNFRPVVMSAWGTDILNVPHWSKILWYFTKKSLERADLIYSASGDILEKITTIFGISPKKVKINTHGVDVEMFKPMAKIKSEEKIIILSNRNLYPVYNIKTLLDAIPLIIKKYPSAQFKIIGEGPEEKELKEYASSLDIDQYIEWMGWTDPLKMPTNLNFCDIFVSTAISDGTPVSMLEAMACGKPCIMTDVGGVSEWIKNGETGYLVQPKDPEELAERIIELIVNRNKRLEIGQNSRDLVVKSANKNKIMTDVSLDYKELVEHYKI